MRQVHLSTEKTTTLDEVDSGHGVPMIIRLETLMQYAKGRQLTDLFS